MLLAAQTGLADQAGLADPLRLSIIVACSATALCVAFGLPAAWLFSQRRRWPWVAALEWLVLLPLVLPPTVIGWLLIVALGRRGLGALLEPLGVPILFTLRGAVIAAAVVAFPLFVLPLRAAWLGLDRHAADAARLDGAGPWARLRRIELPLLRRAIVAALCLCFARAIGEFGATLMVAGSMPGRTETLPLSVWTSVASGRGSEALAPVLLLVGIGAVVALLQRGVLRPVE
jgi:molybdate transport system permease protein